MRPTDHTDDPCVRAADLTLRMGDGHVPTDAEQAFLDDHLAQCEDCRLERAVADVLTHTGDSGPAEPMDEFSRRRFMNYVVTAALSEQISQDVVTIGLATFIHEADDVIQYAAILVEIEHLYETAHL